MKQLGLDYVWWLVAPQNPLKSERGMAEFGGKRFQLIDTPGTLSLVPSSEDEQVTRDVIFRERPDVIGVEE